MIFDLAFQCDLPQVWDVCKGQCYNMVLCALKMLRTVHYTKLLTGSLGIFCWWINHSDRSNGYHQSTLDDLASSSASSEATHLCDRISCSNFSNQRDSKLRVLCLPLINSVDFNSFNAATIIQLAMIRQQKPTMGPMYHSCEYTIAQQIVQCLSIVTACWGQLRPFIHLLQSDGPLISPNIGSGQKSYPRSTTQSRVDESDMEPLNDAEPSSEDGEEIPRYWEAGSQSNQTEIFQSAKK